MCKGLDGMIQEGIQKGMKKGMEKGILTGKKEMAVSLSAMGMSVEEIENHAENIRKVSAAEVRQAAKKLFGGAISVTGIVKPAEEAN